MDSLKSIIATANETGRDFCGNIQGLVTHRAEGGTVRLRATQRGYLVLEAWRKARPIELSAAIAFWDCWLEGRIQVGEWKTMPNAKIKERLFFEQAKKILGELEAI